MRYHSRGVRSMRLPGRRSAGCRRPLVRPPSLLRPRTVLLLLFGLLISPLWDSLPAHGGAAEEETDARILVARAVAANRMRELAIDTLRGCFVYDYRRSEALIVQHRKAMEAFVAQHGAGARLSPDGPRTLCAGRFVAAQDRYRLDAVMLGRGAGNRWGIDPPWSADPSVEAKAAPEPRESGRYSKWTPRTVIIRDGENETRYNEAQRQQMTTPQRLSGPAVCQHPVGAFLCRAAYDHPFSSILARSLDEPKPDAPMVCDWRHLGRETLQGRSCVKVQECFRPRKPPTDDSPPLGGYTTYWLAPGLGYVPVRVEQVYWFGHKQNPPLLNSELWLAEGYREAAPGIWLPSRVRVEKWRKNADQVEWSEIEVVEFHGLSVNTPVGPDDFRFAGPPMGTEVHEQRAPQTFGPSGMDDGRRRAWWAAVEWERQPPAVEPDRAFGERVAEQARQGPPPIAKP